MHDRSAHEDLRSHCYRPDVLVLLPACAYTLQQRQQARFETVTRDTIINPIHEPNSGYDHE